MPDYSLKDVAQMGAPRDYTLAELKTLKTPEQPSTWDAFKEGAGNLAYGLAKGLADPVYGVTQLGVHGLNALSGGRMADFTKEYDQRLTDIERQYQADTPGSIAAGTGRVFGNLAMPVKGITALKGATLVPRAINAAGTGAAIGAAQPVFNAGDTTLSDLVTGDRPNDYWGSKGLQVGVGAASGGALSAAGSMAGSAFNAVRPLVAPRSAAANILTSGVQKSGDPGLDPLTVAARIRAAGQLVPGSLPTTAQVAGIPQLVMAEKTLKNNPNYRPAFEQRAIANNQARMDAVRGVAQTPQALEAAISARQELTAPLYDAANSTVHPIDDALQSILDRPSAQAALVRGQKLAAEKGETAGLQPGTPATNAMQVSSPVLDATGQPFTSSAAGQAATPPSIDGKTLQYIKMGLDDLQVERKARGGMDSHEMRALGATRNDLDSWLIDNSPAFKDANGLYAQASVPINTMQAGQQILGDLSSGSLNAAGDVSPALAQFRARYAAALKASPYGIDPEAQKTLDAVQADLQRETVSNSINSSGSDTAFNLQAPNWLSSKLFGEGLDGKSALGKVVGGVGGWMTGGPMGTVGGVVGAQKLGAMAGTRVNNSLQDAMLDPQLFAQMLEDAARRARAQAQGGGLLGVVPRAGAIGSEEALTGLLGSN
jgi:hypothetical protein